jgi:type IV pilus assembly protein PilO
MAITVEDIKKLSMRKKAIIVAVICILIAYFTYSFLLQANFEKQAALDTRLAELTHQVEEKEKKAAQLDKYIKEVNALKAAYQIALAKLPNKKEIPGLLSSIALAGKQSDVEFILFEPVRSEPPAKPAESKETPSPGQKPSDPTAAPAEEKFYEEIPVKVSVRGSYHSVALFFEKVARLPRIVNIEDISMGDAKKAQGKDLSLVTSCTIKTYMFVEKKDEQSKNPDEKA